MSNKLKPNKILIRGAKVHNLKNIDIEIPLNKIVGIAGVSGSGKSSLALGVLYAEGSRRYLEALSTYTRRRMSQSPKADVDEVLYIPASLALHQRPSVPGIRSTFGTSTELLNNLRLMFSRLASHRCPNGHYSEPTLAVASGKEIICEVCSECFFAPGAEQLAFNSQGACKKCDGTGTVRTVDISTLVPDENLSIDEGAVAPWKTLMWSLMIDVCREMGVRTNIPFKNLTNEEKEIVYRGKPEKKHILYKSKTTNLAGELDFTYYSAIRTVENALSKVQDEKGMKRVEKFLKEELCPDCFGTRLSEIARMPKLRNMSLDEVCNMTLSEVVDWVNGIPKSLPEKMRPMAEAICESFNVPAKKLIDLGLDYISLDRASSTLSTGERQRMQLARVVRNRTTGVLYILDEPSIGLHPSNIAGLITVMNDLVSDGNSVVLVDHDAQILSKADWIVELGEGSGINGGNVINTGTIAETIKNPLSKIGRFLSGDYNPRVRPTATDCIFKRGTIDMKIDKIHTVKPLSLKIPKCRFTVVTGVSGSGKTTLILESLVPAIECNISGKRLPQHIININADGIRQIKLIDATPIGANVRSTVATYVNVHDELRKVFAKTSAQYKAGDFSYNTGSLRCTTCDGTGIINLDVQFLPDVEITCPECRGSRYSKTVEQIKYKDRSLSDVMKLEINNVIDMFQDIPVIKQRLEKLCSLGIGYLTLGEATTTLSGGEAQRLKLSFEIGRKQENTIFVFDEPTIGLHPLDVRSLLKVFQKLIEKDATVVVIEHDLDVVANADYVVDMGLNGGEKGGEIIFTGTPEELTKSTVSKTGKYLKKVINSCGSC